MKKVGLAFLALAPQGLHGIAQGQLRPELVEGRSATLGPEAATDQTIARRAYIKGFFNRPVSPWNTDERKTEPPQGATDQVQGSSLDVKSAYAAPCGGSILIALAFHRLTGLLKKPFM